MTYRPVQACEVGSTEGLPELAHGLELRLLPSQAARVRELTGEQRLCVAAIEDAALVVLKGPPPGERRHRGRAYAEARVWLLEATATAPWTFAWCCEHVGIEPAVLREALVARAAAGIPMPDRRRMNGRFGKRVVVAA